jgi:hypothetical protein
LNRFESFAEKYFRPNLDSIFPFLDLKLFFSIQNFVGGRKSSTEKKRPITDIFFLFHHFRSSAGVLCDSEASFFCVIPQFHPRFSLPIFSPTRRKKKKKKMFAAIGTLIVAILARVSWSFYLTDD